MVVVQSLALVGAVVGGLRARTLRLQLQRVNEQLRSINAALRNQIESDLVPEADEAEAFKAYRHALENAMVSERRATTGSACPAAGASGHDRCLGTCASAPHISLSGARATLALLAPAGLSVGRAPARDVWG